MGGNSSKQAKSDKRARTKSQDALNRKSNRLTSNAKDSIYLNDDTEYFNMLKQKQKMDAQKHEKVSNQDGTAWKELQRQKKNQSFTNQSNIMNLSQSSGGSGMHSKSGVRISKVIEPARSGDALGVNQSILFGSIEDANTLTKSSKKPKTKIEVIFERNKSISETKKSDKVNRETTILQDPNFEWVKLLLEGLETLTDTIYAAKVKERIDSSIKSWTSKLDPKPYRKLYINKVYQSEFPSGMSSQVSRATSNNISSSPSHSGSVISVSPSARPSTKDDANINYDKQLAKQYIEHDIVGLTVVQVSQKYITKFNTLRQHLYMVEHPIAKILSSFREILLEYLRDKTEAILIGASFYERDSRLKFQERENDKLLKRVQSDINTFVSLMHDAVVCFYRLDIKQGQDVEKSECLTNLLTSLVLKNPVYSEVHTLIQIKHKREVKKIMQTIKLVRSKYDLDTVLKVDPVAIGTQVVKARQPKSDEPNFSTCMDVTDKQALDAFKDCLKKIEQVRHVSSPILKVITFSRAMDELMGLMSEVGEIQDADVLQNMILYIICSIKNTDSAYLGARFLEECTYVDNFMTEDQMGLIQQYTNIEHVKGSMRYLKKGLKSIEKHFLTERNDSEEMSTSSEEEEESYRKESYHFATEVHNQHEFVNRQHVSNTQVDMNGPQLLTVPAEYDDRQVSISSRQNKNRSYKQGAGKAVLDKLRDEGLFKSLTSRNNSDDNPQLLNSELSVPLDAALQTEGSFLGSAASPNNINYLASQTRLSPTLANKSESIVAVEFQYDANDKNDKLRKNTLGSKINSTSTGISSSLQPGSSVQTGTSSISSGHKLSTLNADKENDLFPINEEELQVEEACENELENNSKKMRDIRDPQVKRDTLPTFNEDSVKQN